LTPSQFEHDPFYTDCRRFAIYKNNVGCLRIPQLKIPQCYIVAAMIARNFDEAFSHVRQLVHDFRQNEAQFLSPKYDEANVRTDFINRFWMALGWDVTHDVQKNPHEREVEVEKSVNVEGRGKRADYSFAVAPNYRDVRFFVEAKKPSRQLDNAQDYFQTMRYGWHARTPVAVLMDFEQFRVLDCRYKPDIDVVMQYGALEKFHYTDYADEEKFRRIYHLFSREDVGRGALDEYVARLPKPGRRGVQGALFARGAYQSIDESFLQDLDGYREQLARVFKQGNPQLDGAQLTEATQRTLDRLVFMRFLEDKLIETDELVERFAQARAPWAEFVAASRRLDRTYNGIIFKEHTLLDAPAFRVDERAFAGICENLSHVRSPYDFNLIPIHILGSIYERFLGKTIETDAEGATVVEKPEVRKAGGVYYTPEYIVRYIVEQTVGKLIEGKTPEEIRPLRFADISCGSGSFLLGVFDLLLSYHAGYYNRNKRTRAEGLKAGCTETDEGTLRLSLLQKRTILLNNIYGVDVDAQAVEVAQLSLYLKLLEAETTLTTRTHQLAFREALLPSLSRNIISGNSLIDFDILSGHLFEPEEERKLNPMNFAQEFPHVMRDGGFDAIVGNPPWGAEFSKKEKSYLVNRYPQVPTKTKDSYLYFIYRALSILREGRPLGFIVPNTWLLINNASEFRRELLSFNVREITDHGDGVFKQATVESSTLLLDNAKSLDGNCHAVRYRKGAKVIDHTVNKRIWLDDEFCRIILDLTEETNLLLKRLKAGNEPFDNSCQIIWGIKPYQVGYGVPAQTREVVENRIFHASIKEGDEWKPLLVGSDVNRYTLQFPNNLFIKYGRWLMYPSNESLMLQPKILLRQTSDILRACYDDNNYYCQNSLFIVHSEKINLKYLLGLLNSKLLGFAYKFSNPQTAKVFAEVKPSAIKSLPIRTINFSNAADKARHERMVALVEGMLAAKRQLAGAGTEAERNLYERKCAAIDKQIDALVYELYDLTPQEITLVEAG
jgi:adenine-specific DNA-methyltransferase